MYEDRVWSLWDFSHGDSTVMHRKQRQVWFRKVEGKSKLLQGLGFQIRRTMHKQWWAVDVASKKAGGIEKTKTLLRKGGLDVEELLQSGLQ